MSIVRFSNCFFELQEKVVICVPLDKILMFYDESDVVVHKEYPICVKLIDGTKFHIPGDMNQLVEEITT